jgi:lipopolysaccharide biosynthesis regulator YciM
MATKTLDLSGISNLFSTKMSSMEDILKEIKDNQAEMETGMVEQQKALKAFGSAVADLQKTVRENQTSLVALIDATGKAYDKMAQQLDGIENIQQAGLQRLDSGFQNNTTKLEQIHQAMMDDRSKINELLARVPENKPVEKGWKHYGVQALKVVGIALGGAGTVLAYQYAFGSDPQQPQPQLQITQ